MPVHMVAKFVRQYSFDFVGRVIRQQRIRENDAARVAQSGKGCVRFFAFFRKLPLINAAYPGPRALTEFYLSDDFLPLLKTYFGSEAPMLHMQILMEHVP